LEPAICRDLNEKCIGKVKSDKVKGQSDREDFNLKD